MTATERLRELLDERGVEHEGTDRSLRWRDRNGVMMQAFPLADGELGMDVWSCTPEQAIAATLGDVPYLPHFWTHDGVLHIEATRMPTRIVVCEGGTCEFVPKRELDASEAENAKLRELCAGLWSVMWACAEQRCPHRHEDCFVVNGNGDGPKGCEKCWYERRMRELGVEVEP